MIDLFAVTLFTSAALLFFAEPMVGKLILPLLGGTPAVWNTCVMFFQLELLLGYLYAHLIGSRLGLTIQIAVQLALLVVGLVALPLTIPQEIPDAAQHPISTVVAILARALGLPLLAIAATAPLLQRWLAMTKEPTAHDPFFLYAVSNAGSLLALLTYPFLIEPALPLSSQRWVWSAGYLALFGLTAVCGWQCRKRVRPGVDAAERVAAAAADRESAKPTVDNWLRLRWLALAGVPSSLLLSVTTHMSTDVAAVPLLWVVPLALYLVTYVLAFARRRFLSVKWPGRLLPLAIAASLFVLAGSVERSLWWLIPVPFVAFLLAALVCHIQLASERPSTSRLTEYYLWISLGGFLGGLFNTIVAPLVFTRTTEYTLGLVPAAFLRPLERSTTPRMLLQRSVDLLLALVPAAVMLNMPALLRVPFTLVFLHGVAFTVGIPLLLCLLLAGRPLRFGLAVAGVAYLATFHSGDRPLVLHEERTFFGTLRVTDSGRYHTLTHGTTTHGSQSTDPERRCDPLTYYSRTSPVGELFGSFVGPFAKFNVAITGLGAATMAAYAQPQQQWTFFEINPAVERIARNPNYFTYLRDCVQHYRIVIDDARLGLVREEDARFDVMIFDAFSSDSVPVHLATREALALYLRKLAPRGVLAFHISNRHLDLAPVIGNLAQDSGLAGLLGADDRVTRLDGANRTFSSTWVVLARNRADFGDLSRSERWIPVPTTAAPPWTDDYSNIATYLKVLRR